MTEVLDGSQIVLSAGDRALLKQAVNLSPEAPLVTQVDLPDGVTETDLLLRVCDGQGHEVIHYMPQTVEEAPLPEPKTPPPPPGTFETIEELYLTGLHLEQYRHPTIAPEPYWEAALAKDPTDVRCDRLLRKGVPGQSAGRPAVLRARPTAAQNRRLCRGPPGAAGGTPRSRAAAG